MFGSYVKVAGLNLREEWLIDEDEMGIWDL